MKLSAKFLINVSDVNNFDFADQWDISEGSAHKLYFQLTDKQKDDLRYLSQATVIDAVTVTFLSIDDNSEITKTATQEFADDKSIWSIELLATEIPNAGAVKMSITEDGVESQFRVEQAIVVDLLEAGSC
tara:strand:- start:12058 stop:12447 length:390 start_codon:yes stop_codon:yes gene_type:complete